MNNISRKEFFAGCALAGFVGNPTVANNYPADEVAKMVFVCADALNAKFVDEENKKDSKRTLYNLQSLAVSLTRVEFAQYKEYLPQYLRLKKVDINADGDFHCINPKHNDSTTSCTIFKENNIPRFHCFGCGCGGDIYDAVELLEGITGAQEQLKFLKSFLKESLENA